MLSLLLSHRSFVAQRILQETTLTPLGQTPPFRSRVKWRHLEIVVRESEQQCATMPDLDWSKCPVVESVPGKVSGAWVLKGTRMPVSAIFENIEAGASIDDILEWFEGLDRTQVEAVLEFVARSLDRASEYIS